MFIELHVIQTLPPSNPNRGQDGNVKSITYGGALRSRMSSQSQKRAARLWYGQNLPVDRAHLALRSRRWDSRLADLLEVGEPERRLTIARLLLGMFNVKAEKLLENCLDPAGNLLFLSQHEVQTIAAIASKHEPLLLDLADRVAELQQFMEADGGKSKKKSYDNHPSKTELAPLVKDLSKIKNSIPGDVAVFGRMMAQLTETSVDGCVQVADAISVNSTQRKKASDGWVVGEVDFFSAQDDIAPVDDPDAGAGMIGETGITTPIYYRYANICVSELARLVGDADIARQFADAFLRGFIHALPSGYIRAHAHMTLPEFVLVQTTNRQPYQHAPAFLTPVDTLGPDGVSISQQAVKKLLDRRNEMIEMYGGQPDYSGIVSLTDHYPGGVPLDSAIERALAIALPRIDDRLDRMEQRLIELEGNDGND